MGTFDMLNLHANKERISPIIRQKTTYIIIYGMNWWTNETDLIKSFGSYGAKDIDFGINSINGKSKGWAIFKLYDEHIMDELLSDFNSEMLNGQNVFLWAANQEGKTDLVSQIVPNKPRLLFITKLC